MKASKEGTVIVTCNDCLQYAPTCDSCFVQLHANNPLHWAQVWDNRLGFYTKKDYSALPCGNPSINFCHNGAKCPNPRNDKPIKFTIAHTNGIHATKVVFCGCPSSSEKIIDQLMLSRLFPASMKDPRTAFTFDVLRDFHLHTLESKKSAYDYSEALRRLTDNSFPTQVPVRIRLS